MFKKGASNFSNEIAPYAVDLDRKMLTKLFAEERSAYERLSLGNMSINKDAIHRQSLEGFDLASSLFGLRTSRALPYSVATDRFLWFQLERQAALQAWRGKLVVEWSGERGWRRWAAKNTMPVHAIHDDSILVERMPEWSQMVLDWAQLEALPVSWQHRLSQWRGIYVIVDRKSGKSYVGSAYGKDNLLGRWRSYAATGSGGNVELRGRDPRQFQFAILERVSPDAPADEVIRLESCWKDRLGTREFGLNKN